MSTERSALLAPAPALSATTNDEDPTQLSVRSRNIILGAVWTGVFLGALDTTIVATIYSDISSSFNSSNQSSWLGTSYLLSTATFTPIYGRLSDIVGRRGAALTALFFFTIGTTICGFSYDMTTLIVGRLIAGMGGGGMLAISSVICSDLVPLKQRGLFQGIANCFFGLGAGLGGPLGGVISDWIGWRWAFIIQLPILVLAFGLVSTFVKYTVPGQGRSKREMISRIDYGGSICLLISLGSLLVALSYKNNDALEWIDPLVWFPLLLAIIFSIGFVLVEAFHAAEPVLPLRLLITRNGICVAGANFFMSMVTFSVLYFLPMFFEIVKQQKVAQAGAHLLPNSIALSMGSLFAGYCMRATGRYYYLTVISAALPVFSLTLLALMDDKSGTFYTWFAVVPSGFGFSAVVTSILIALIASVERVDMATSTGMTYLFRYLGQILGVCFSSSLLQSVLTSELSNRITGPGSTEIIDKIRHVASSIPSLTPSLRTAAIESYAAGLRAVFILNAGISLICFAFTLFLGEFPLPGSFAEEEEGRKRRVEEATARGE